MRNSAVWFTDAATVEHVFGTLEHLTGWPYFVTRTFANVRIGMRLHELAYNLKPGDPQARDER